MLISVEFLDGLTTEQIVFKIGQLSNPQIILWYVGYYGLRKGGVDFYRDHLISPSFESNLGVKFWLVDLTAWGAFNHPNCSLQKSHHCCDLIEAFSDDRIRCIRSAKIFQKLQEISDQEMVGYFNSALRRNFVSHSSKHFPASGIKVRDIFPKVGPLIEPWQEHDTRHAYSIFQYFEGCLLIDEVLSRCLSSEGDEIQIIFALPNDELKYYRDEEGSFEKDVRFLILNRYKHLEIKGLKIKICFFAFKYGAEVHQRPYNAPGRVLKAKQLVCSDFI